MISMITQERLRELVSYDPETGVFRWVARGRGIRTGQEAGSIDKKYRIIHLDGVSYYAQRLAWFWVNGIWPRLIRFQNEDTHDCRIDNLREGFYVTTKYDHKTKEGKSAHQREYRSMRREEFRQKERERKFGLSLAAYAELVAQQDNKCAICGQPETQMRNGSVKALAVDHDHETGLVRGLLCCDCNQAIGKMKEDRNILLSAVRYLDKHSSAPATVIPLSLVAKSGE